MARLIDADDATEKIRFDAERIPDDLSRNEAIAYRNGMFAAVETVARCPAVHAVEVVHGRWIEHSHLEVGGECSVCGWQFQWFENDEAHYCPHCGAKMDLEASPNGDAK